MPGLRSRGGCPKREEMCWRIADELECSLAKCYGRFVQRILYVKYSDASLIVAERIRNATVIEVFSRNCQIDFWLFFFLIVTNNSNVIFFYFHAGRREWKITNVYSIEVITGIKYIRDN